ncbi:large subunit ribosomal protein L10 [Desulfitispora alkaliphila]|uniref:50S ribosomal protein L10 n=1 Tax=Desulfitispora alkaliphila TaxID=622674 RepID=UPI003D213C9D
MAKVVSKQEVVADLTDKLKNSQGVVITDYRGLNVAEVTQLRAKLREANIDYKVVKNTLTKIAAKNAEVEGVDQFLEGPTAIAFSAEDPVAPAKILSEFAKAHKELEIKGGVLDGSAVTFEQVKELADLPSREELLAKVVGGMQAPISGFVNVLQGPIRNLAYALQAVKEQKEAS